MSFVPQVVTPEGHLSHLSLLRFPQDKKEIRKLSLAEKQVWYAAQDPQLMIQTSVDFHEFWVRTYVIPLKIKRFFYALKFW
jgi:hypothetical protein